MKDHVRDYDDRQPLSSINEIYVSVFPRSVKVGQCLLCRAVFINGKRVKGLYVETKEFCEHKNPRS